MSRQMHQVEITEEHMRAYKRAQIAAAVLFIGFFTLFVVFAPDGDSRETAAPPTVASAADL